MDFLLGIGWWIPEQWARNPNSLLLPLVLLTGVVVYAFYKQHTDPRRKELAMARKKERQVVADIVSAALQDAAHRKEIPPDVWHKYNKKLARALGLEDMLPKPKVDLNKVKILCRQRLSAAGVNVKAALNKMRRTTRTTTKKHKLRA